MSTTRGYHPHSHSTQRSSGDGSKQDDDGIPYDPAHLNDQCYQCKNQDSTGRKVKCHRQGAPICPMVRNGKYPFSPYWKKIIDGQTQGDKKGKGTGTGKGTKGKKDSSGKRDPSTGRFTPKHCIFIVTSEAQEPETATPAQSRGQSSTPDPAQLPNIPDPQAYIFVAGTRESVTFAWPTSAAPYLAQQMVYTPDSVPPTWDVISKDHRQSAIIVIMKGLPTS